MFSPDAAAAILNLLNLLLGAALLVAVARRRTRAGRSVAAVIAVCAGIAIGIALVQLGSGASGSAANKPDPGLAEVVEKVDKLEAGLRDTDGKVATLTAQVRQINELKTAPAPPPAPIRIAASGWVERGAKGDIAHIGLANIGDTPARMIWGDARFCPIANADPANCLPARPNKSCHPRNFLCPAVFGINQRLQRYATVLPPYRRRSFIIRVSLVCDGGSCTNELVGTRSGDTLTFAASAPPAPVTRSEAALPSRDIRR